MLQIWDAIHDGSIFSCPSLLASFIIVCFADIKKYKFTYHFASPTWRADPAWRLESSKGQEHDRNVNGNGSESILNVAGNELPALVESIESWQSQVDLDQRGFFLVKRVQPSPQSQGALPTTLDGTETMCQVGSLQEYEDGFFNGIPKADQFVAFADPSTYPSNPGWMLRNLLMLVHRRWKLTKIQILCYRDVASRLEQAKSIVLRIEVPPQSLPGDLAKLETKDAVMPKVTGLERNSVNKLISRVANLGEYMDPHRY